MSPAASLTAPTSRSYTVEDVLPLLKHVTKRGDHYYFCCPVHEDRNPSASMRRGDDVEILFTCHRGCTFEEFIAVLQNPETRRDHAAQTKSGPRPAYTTVATYRYTDAAGELMAEKHRRVDELGRKSFFWTPKGITAPLYRLHEIQGQAAVVIVEGEKDCDALWALTPSIAATCSPHGASHDTSKPKWAAAYTRQLVDVGVNRVAVLADNDPAGLAHRDATAAACHAAGLTVLLPELPDLADGGDVSDWLAAGGTRKGLAKILKAAPLYKPATTGPEPPRLETVATSQHRIGQHTDWLVDRMLAVGDMSVLVAKPGIGKSTFAAELAVAVAYGRPFLGRQTRQGLVVYLAFEGARSTMAHMVRRGHDPESPAILIWRSDADTQDPAAWLDTVLKDVTPALIVVDTLADFARVRHGSSNAGYEDMVAKLGAVYVWAQARRAHIHLLHHGGKGDRDGIDAALGTIGIVSKPGTVLDYRPMSKEEGAPRVLKGIKHREGDLEDLPALVLDFDREGGLRVAGYREEVAVRELGVALIAVVGRSHEIREAEALDEVEGRRSSKLDALKDLTHPQTGMLVRTGTPRSRTFPLRLSLREDMTTEAAIAAWRGACRGRDERAISTWFPDRDLVPTPRELSQTSLTRVNKEQVQGQPDLVPPISSNSGTKSKDFDSVETSEETAKRLGSHEYKGTSTEAPSATYCPTCQRFRCQCKGAV
jgi:hypothetical protein